MSEEWGLLLAVLCVAAIVILAAFVVRSLPQGRSCFYAIGAASAVTIYVVQAMLNVFGTTDILPLTGCLLYTSGVRQNLWSCSARRYRATSRR